MSIGGRQRFARGTAADPHYEDQHRPDVLAGGTHIDEISWREKVQAIQRELALRRSFYPKRVADGRMRQAEADRGIAVLEAIFDDYFWMMERIGSIDAARAEDDRRWRAFRAGQNVTDLKAGAE